MKPYPIVVVVVVASRCTRSQGGGDEERRWRWRWRNWRGAYVARALNCVSILNVGPEPVKPNKCQSATLQRNSTTSVVFTGFLSARALLCSLSRSPLIGDLCERRSTHRAHCCLGLSVHYRAFHFHFQFVWKNSFTLCCCSSATAACVCKYCLADDFWLIELTLLCLRAYRAVTENSRSRWRKQHASRAEAHDRRRCRCTD